MLSDCKTFDVLKYEGLRVELGNQSHEVENEAVARVIEDTLTDQRKSLAGRSAKYAIDLAITQIRKPAYILTCEVRNGTWNDGSVREVELVHGTVDRIDFHGGSHFETGLLEP